MTVMGQWWKKEASAVWPHQPPFWGSLTCSRSVASPLLQGDLPWTRSQLRGAPQFQRPPIGLGLRRLQPHHAST